MKTRRIRQNAVKRALGIVAQEGGAFDERRLWSQKRRLTYLLHRRRRALPAALNTLYGWGRWANGPAILLIPSITIDDQELLTHPLVTNFGPLPAMSPRGLCIDTDQRVRMEVQLLPAVLTAGPLSLAVCWLTRDAITGRERQYVSEIKHIDPGGAGMLWRQFDEPCVLVGVNIAWGRAPVQEDGTGTWDTRLSRYLALQEAG